MKFKTISAIAALKKGCYFSDSDEEHNTAVEHNNRVSDVLKLAESEFADLQKELASARSKCNALSRECSKLSDTIELVRQQIAIEEKAVPSRFPTFYTSSAVDCLLQRINKLIA